MERLALSYMTRSGNLTLRDYAREQPDVVRAALDWLGPDAPVNTDRLDEWVLAQPLNERALRLPQRCRSPADLHAATAVADAHWSGTDVWDDAATDLIARATAWQHIPILLHGPDSPEGLGGRIDLAERIRLRSDRTVGVVVPDSAVAHGAAAVGTGRADFVVRSYERQGLERAHT